MRREIQRSSLEPRMKKWIDCSISSGKCAKAKDFADAASVIGLQVYLLLHLHSVEVNVKRYNFCSRVERFEKYDGNTLWRILILWIFNLS